ncbi:MAG: folate family ECF transporter S component [Clostridia bacterium]|nr:folate family ECF transporter S component [Clostridia bacterium]
MQKNSYAVRGARSLAISAMLVSMSIVIGIFCKTYLNFGMGLFRVTFENLPIILGGILFGPGGGALIGAASDIVSYLLSGQAYPINLIVTLGAASVGAVSGFCARFVVRKRGTLQVIVSGALAHVVGSMIIKPIGLFTFYQWMVLWRIPMYLVIAPMEIAVICWLLRRRSFSRVLYGASADEKATEEHIPTKKQRGESAKDAVNPVKTDNSTTENQVSDNSEE